MIYLDDFKCLEGRKEVETLESLTEKTNLFMRDRGEKILIEEGHTLDDGDFLHVTTSYAVPHFYSKYVDTFSIRFFQNGKWDLFIRDLKNEKHHISQWKILAKKLDIDEIVKFLEKV